MSIRPLNAVRLSVLSVPQPSAAGVVLRCCWPTSRASSRFAHSRSNDVADAVADRATKVSVAASAGTWGSEPNRSSPAARLSSASSRVVPTAPLTAVRSRVPISD